METVHICDTGTGIEPLVVDILSGIVVGASNGGIGEGTEVQFPVSSFETGTGEAGDDSHK